MNRKNTPNTHQIDIHHGDWSQDMDAIMAGRQRLDFMNTKDWYLKGSLYVPRNKSDEIIINEVGPRESKQAGG